MDREQFFSFVKYSVQDILNERGVEGRIELQEVTKSNDQVLTGLTLRCEGEHISPCIYLDDMYERYQHGLEVGCIVREVVDLVEIYGDPEIDLKKFTDYEAAKEHLTFRLVDISENTYWLQDKIWEPMGDFAKVCCISVEREADGYMSAVVTTSNQALLGVTREQLLADAQKNLQKSEYVFVNIEDMMATLFPGMPDMDPVEIPSTPLYVLTNPSKVQGAVMIARPDVLKAIGDQFGCDYYVLPSSKHEVLIVPVDAGIELGILCGMVEEINWTEVSIEDKLSDQVQYYDREKEQLRNALESTEKEVENKKAPREKEQER